MISILAALGSGCVHTKSDRSVSLRPEQFADPTAATAPEPAVPASAPAPTPEVRTAFEASGGVMDVTSLPGEPTLVEAGRVVPVGPSVLVDGTAGYVNNRAVYINEFLEPMANRLRQAAREMPRAEWIRLTRQRIRDDLQLLIRDELLRAEAMAQIAGTEEQRRGLLSYFDRQRSSILARYGGTQSSADEQLSQRDDQPLPDFGSNIQGKSVDEVLDAMKRTELIRYHIQSNVSNRAYVTWRDVLIAYQNQYDQFNPPPTVVMRMICISSSRADAIEELRRGLEAAEEFEALAQREWNTFKRKEGGRFERSLEGPLESSVLVTVPALDRAFHALKPGEVAGPIEVGKDLYWIKLEEVRKSPRAMDLYEAQLSIEGNLRKGKFDTELARHVEQLKARASYTGLDEMTDRLTAVAIERYNPVSSATADTKPGGAGGL